jgi:hypothetical protein
LGGGGGGGRRGAQNLMKAIKCGRFKYSCFKPSGFFAETLEKGIIKSQVGEQLKTKQIKQIRSYIIRLACRIMPV